jgi:hypothetical protein
MDVIAEGGITYPSQIERAIEQAKEIPDADYQTQALEKMAEALQRVLDWEEESRKALDAIDPMDRRYTDRKGAEQVRTEVLVHERAMDRTTRVLAQVSKMAIDDKMVSLGKAQTELMIRLMMKLITELELSQEDSDRARMILLELFKAEANLAPRIQAHATQTLGIENKPSNVTPLYNPASGGVTKVTMGGRTVFDSGSN